MKNKLVGMLMILIGILSLYTTTVFAGVSSGYCDSCANSPIYQEAIFANNNVAHTRRYRCSICKATYSKIEYHSYGSWSSNGVNAGHSRSCECGFSQTESHSYGSWSYVSSSQHRKDCSVCTSYTVDSHTTTTAATCTTAAYCGSCKSNFGSALGHGTPSSYSYDNIQHWMLCTRSCGAYVYSKENHYDNDKNGYCDVCGYLMDITPPVITISPMSNLTLARSHITNVTVTDEGGSGLSVCKYVWTTSTTAPTASSSFTTSFTSGANISTPVVSGVYYLHVYAEDGSGNYTIESSDGFNLDNTAPVGNIKINNGALYTTVRDVVLSISTTSSDTDYMAISETTTKPAYEAFATSKDWTLTSAEGTKVIYYWFKDTLGNESEMNSVSIILDTSNPTLGTLAVQSVTTNTISVAVKGAQDAASGIKNYDYYLDGNLVASAQGATYTYTGLNPNISYNLSYVVRDNVDKTTGPSTAISKYTLAAIPVNLTATDGTAETSITLTWSANGNASGTNYTIQYTNDGLTWNQLTTTTATTYTHTGLAKNETYQYKVKATNHEGIDTNYSGAATGRTLQEVISDSIILDSTAPVASFVINQVDSIPTSITVNIVEEYEIDVLKYKWTTSTTKLTSESEFTDGTFTPGDAIKPLSTFTSGNYYLQVYARDVAGNDGIYISGVFQYYAPVSNPSIVINSGAEYTNSKNVTLTLGANGASQMYISEVAVVASTISASSWETYATSKTFTLSEANGTKTVYAYYKDVYGNIVSSSDSIILDTVAPGIGDLTGTVYKNIASGSTTNMIVSSLTDFEGSGLKRLMWYYSINNGENVVGVSKAITDSTTTDTFALPITEEGNYVIYLYLEDNAGNASVKSTTLVVDRTPPTIGTMTEDQTLNLPVGETISIEAGEFADVGSGIDYCTWQYKIGTGEWSTATRGTILDNASAYSITLTSATSYTVRVTLYDKAGNSSYKETTISIDRTAPSLGTLSLTATTNSITATVTNVSDNVQVGGYEFYLDGIFAVKQESNIYTFEGLTCATAYDISYKVYDIYGNYTEMSTAETKYTLANVPTNLVASDETYQNIIEVKWENNENPQDVIYELMSSDDQATWSLIYTGTATTFNHSDLAMEITKYYKVRAKNQEGVYTEYSNVDAGSTMPQEESAKDTEKPVVYALPYNITLDSETLAKSADQVRITISIIDEFYNSHSLVAGDIVVYVAGEEITLSQKSIESTTKTEYGADIVMLVSGISGNGDLTIKIPAGKVQDIAGNTNDETVSYTSMVIDNIAPTVTITKPSRTWSDNKVTLTITGTDESGIKYITVNGTQLEVNDGVATYTVSQTGTLVINVADNAENITTKNETIASLGATISLSERTFTYDGTEHKPTVTIKVGNTTLVENTDYTLTYSNNKNVGTGTVTITGIGSYQGVEGTEEFTINTRTLTVKPATSQTKEYGATEPTLKYTYTGNASGETPSFSGALTRVAGEDVGEYLISQGTLSVGDSDTFKTTNYNITFDNSSAVNFTITAKPLTITWSNTSLIYNGSAQKPTATVSSGVTNETVNLTVSGAQTKVGSNYTATATISSVTGGQGNTTNYTLTNPSTTFAITGKDLSSATVTLDPTSYTYDGKAKEPTTKVVLDGSTLTRDTDYTVTYTNNVNAGTATAIITGTGNYKGTTSKTFTISKATSVLTLSQNSGIIDYNSAGIFTVTSNAAGTLTITSGNTTYVGITAVDNLNIAANGTSTVTYQGLKATDNATTITIKFVPTDTTNYTEATATYTVTKVNKLTATLTADPSEIEVTYGEDESETISYTYVGDANPIYNITSSNENVVDVNIDSETMEVSCSIVGAGEAIITISVAETENYTSASATVKVKVNKADITPIIYMNGYTYGGTKATPVVYNNFGQGTVTYYYNTINSNSGGIEWSKVTSSTYLNAGTYYMYAVVEATNNYNGATSEPVEFTILKAMPTLSVEPNNVSIFEGFETTAEVTYVGDGEVTIIPNDTSIATATLNSNLITIKGVKPGITTVTVSATSGTNYADRTSIINVEILSANYTDGTTYYVTLKDAFDNAATGSTITVLKNVEDSSDAIVASGKSFILDTNGKTVTKTVSKLINNGVLTIEGTGKIETGVAGGQKLADVVEIGNYVNYPVEYDNVADEIGGLTTYKGWRVIEIEDDGTVKLVSAGVPLTYNRTGTATEAVTALTTNFLTTGYRETGFKSSLKEVFTNEYTESNSGVPIVRAMTMEDVLSATGLGAASMGIEMDLGNAKYENLFDLNERYFLASPYSSTLSDYLYYVLRGGGVNFDDSDLTLGIRPVVSLKADLYTTGKNEEGAWNIALASETTSLDTLIINNGTLTISNGTLESTGTAIESTTANLTIGAEGSGVSTTSPVIKGDTYSIESANGFKFYDGILKGVTSAFSGEVTAKEAGYVVKYGTETIDSTTYNTAILIREFTSDDVSISPTTYTYDGTAKEPTVTVTVDGTDLTKDTDYTVEYTNNIDAGTGTVTITGIGNYSGNVTKTFTINKKSVEVVWTNTSLTYNGTSQMPTATLASGVTNETINITVSGAQTNVGTGYTATATVTGVTGGQAKTENYTVTNLTTTFAITAKSISGATVTLNPTTYVYDSEAKTPAVTVTLDSKTLTKDTDYTVTYTNNTNVGTATATITGKGNYSGTASKTFTITAATPTLTATPSSIEMIVGDTATIELTYNGDGTLGDSPADTGIATSTLSSKTITVKGVAIGTTTITVTASAGNNYSAATITIPIIVTANSSDITIALSQTEYTYDGTAKTPTVTVKDKETELTENTDYTVEYSNNINAGTATVTITGIGNYDGVELIKAFTINKKSVAATWENTTLTYNGTAQKPTATAASGVANETISLTVDGAQTNVGTGYLATAEIVSVTGGQAKAENYTLTNTTTTFTISFAEDAEFDVTLSGTTFDYDGTAHEPTVTVKFDTATLVEGTDYTVRYENNKNAGTGSVTITGIGNYYGLETIEILTINKKDFTIKPDANQYKTYGDSDPILTYTYSGNIDGETPEFTGTLARVEGENVGTYIIEQGSLTPVSNETFNVKNYNVIFDNTLNFEITEGAANEDKVNFTINPKEVEVKWDETTLTYNGSAQAPTATTDSGITGETINLSISGAQTEVGTDYLATATMSSVTGGQGKTTNYALKNASTTFDIVLGSDVKFDVTLDNNTFTYNGTAHNPGVTVKVTIDGKEVTLVKDTDYKVTYGENTDAGEGTVTITGIGNYAGITKAETITINKKSIAVVWSNTSLVFNGSAQAPTATVASGVTNETINLSVSGAQTNVGTGYLATAAIASVTGGRANKDNYELTNVNTTFAITVNTAIDFNTTLDNDTFTYDGTKHEPDATVKVTIDGEEITLIEGTDYEVTYGENTDVGEGTVTITGIGNYAGITSTETITINKKSVAVVWANTSLIYNGMAQMPTATVASGVTNETINLTVSGAQTNVGTGYPATAAIASVSGGRANKDNYTLTNTSTTFEIKVDTNLDFNVTLDNDTFTYDGTAHEPNATIKVTIGGNEITLAEGTETNEKDYIITYENNKDAGTGTVVITGTGNYAGIVERVDFTINKATLTIKPTAGLTKIYGDADPVLTYTYSGNVNGEIPGFTGTLTREAGEDIGTYAINQGSLTVIDNGEFKVSNYNVIYDNTVKFEISENPDHYEDIEFTIIPREVEVVWSNTTLIFTGNPQKPTATVDSGVAGETISVTVNGEQINVGKYTANAVILNVTGGQGKTENYKVINTSTEFEIVLDPSLEFNVTLDENTFTYDGTKHEPDATVKVTLDGKEVTLVEGTDYEVTYGENTDAGEGTVTITGIGNYAGITKAETITINKKSVAVVWSNTSLIYNGMAQIPTATVASEVTNETINLSVSGAQTNVGTGYLATAEIASVSGGRANKDNYTLTNTSTEFEIILDPALEFNVTLDENTFTYDGTVHEPNVTIKVTIGGNEITLVEGTETNEKDYIITYENNKDAGTGTVVITGTGNYAGIVERIDFTINKATLTIKPTAGLTKNYGDADPVLTYTYSGNVNDEIPGFTGELIRDEGEDVGTYTINQGTLTVVDNGEFKVSNYNVIYDNTVKFEISENPDHYEDIEFTIIPREVEVVWSNTTLTFNGNPQKPTATVDSGVAGETISVTVNGEQINVGKYTANAVILSVTGGQGKTENYKLTNTSTEFEIVTDPSLEFNVTLDENTFTYDGTEHKPDATVKVTLGGNEVTLVQGSDSDVKDYKVTYENNKDAGTGTVIITGTGNYAGIVERIDFTINKATLTVKPDSGKTKVYGYADPTFTYTYSGNVSGETPKFTGALSRAQGENVGTYEINIGSLGLVDNGTFKANNYEIAVTTGVTFEITKENITNGTLTINPNEYEYDGTAKTPDTTVVVNNITLVRDRDYTVTYIDNVEIGTATVIVTGIGNYEGTLNGTFEITKPNVANGTFTLNPNTFVYDGTEKRPDTILVHNGKTLTRNVDYEVLYYNNINVGDNTAYAIATGIGIYQGEIKATFSITPAPLVGEITLSQNEYEYDATEKEPEVTFVTEDGKVLTEGVDFEVTYKDNVEVGTATVILTGIGNYEGEATKTFEIVKAYLKLTLKDKTVIYTGNEVAIDPVVIENSYEDLSSYVVYKYYADYQLDEEMEGLPKDVGVYYVKAEIKGLLNYNDVESNMVKLVIYGAPTKPNMIGEVNGKTLESGSKTSESVKVLVYGSEVPNAENVEFGYKYSTNGTTWHDYVDGVNVSSTGTTTVYAKAYLKENPALESEIATYVVIIDNTPPVIKDIIVPDVTDTVVVDVEVSGDDIYEIFITQDPTVDPTQEEDGWKKVDDDENGEDGKTVIELTQGDEDKPIYVWAKDEAGNIVGPVEKVIKLSALKIGNQNDNKTTIMFKITDQYLHTANITADDIVIYVNDIISQGKITSLTSEAISGGYKYTAIMEDVTGDGKLSIGLKAGDVYDRAGNSIDVANSKVPTNEITVDNTLPQVDISTSDNMVYIVASDLNMKAIMVNGEIVGRKNGTYSSELKEGINSVVVIDQYGNEVVNEITYVVE